MSKRVEMLVRFLVEVCPVRPRSQTHVGLRVKTHTRTSVRVWMRDEDGDAGGPAREVRTGSAACVEDEDCKRRRRGGDEDADVPA